jgi:hypothetical protein
LTPFFKECLFQKVYPLYRHLLIQKITLKIQFEVVPVTISNPNLEWQL